MEQYESKMRYLEPETKDQRVLYIRTSPDEGFDVTNFKLLEYPVSVTDARPTKANFSLDTHGFAFRDDPEGGSDEMLAILRSGDRNVVAEKYYPHVEQLVKQETGASKVIIFDHTIRRRDTSLRTSDNPDGREQPASIASFFPYPPRYSVADSPSNCTATGPLRSVSRACYGLNPIASCLSPGFYIGHTRALFVESSNILVPEERPIPSSNAVAKSSS